MRSHVATGTAVFALGNTMLVYSQRNPTPGSSKPESYDGYLRVIAPSYTADNGTEVAAKDISIYLHDMDLEEVGQWLIEIAKSKKLANALEPK